MILAERPDGIRIIRLTRPEQTVIYRSSFVGAYQAIFSDAPYNERFTPQEARGVLESTLGTPQNIALLAVRGSSQVIGFGFAVPAIARQDITRVLHGLISVKNSFYLSELGVLPAYRGAGLGRELINIRLQNIDPLRYTHAVLRASATRNTSYEMYINMGFDDMGVYMEVPSFRTDGRQTTDRRLFLSRVITAPEQPGSSGI